MRRWFRWPQLHGLGLDTGQYLFRARQVTVFVLLPTLVVTTCGYVYAAAQHPTYRATATLFVERAPGLGLSSTTGPDIPTAVQLASVYGEMIVNPTLDLSVDRKMQAKYPGFRLEDDTVSSSQPPGVQSSQLFAVSVTDLQPSRAIAATNAVAHAFIRRIKQIESKRFAADKRSLQIQVNGALRHVQAVQQEIAAYRGAPSGLRMLNATLTIDQSTYSSLESSLSTFRSSGGAVVSNLSIYAPAAAATSTKPSPKHSAVLAGFLAVLVFGGLLYLYERLNDLTRSPQEVEDLIGAPVLGAIPSYHPDAHTDRGIAVDRHHSPSMDAYHVIRTKLRFSAGARPPRSILMTSPLPCEGKSTTVAQLARVFSDAGLKVRVVDADLRCPRLQHLFGPDVQQAGLTDVLSTGELHDHGVLPTSQGRLGIIPSGPLPTSPADLLQSSGMRRLIDRLQTEADIVLIDSPPVLSVADAAIVSTVVDGVVLVVDPQSSTRRDIVRTREAIEGVGGTILGVVLNRVRSHGRMSYRNYGYTSTYGDQSRALVGDALEAGVN